jgi:hypothetical protein
MDRRQVVAVVALGTGLLLGGIRPAGSATGSGIWKVIPTPNPGGGSVSNIFFTGVATAGPTDAWAVGIDELNGSRHPLVEHWNGRRWTAMRVPEPPSRQSWFNGVFQFSPTNVWAVGESTDPLFDNQDQRTLVEHWDGTRWSIVPSPNPGVGFGSANVLEAVAGVAANDLWATGWALDPQRNDIQMLFEHYDGTSWKVAPSPSPLGSFQFGMAISALAPGDAWAVGDEAQEKTLAAHWNGQQWTIVPTPSLHDGNSPLNSLTGVTAVSANDVWASAFEGNVNNANFLKPYAEHWDGDRWTLVTTPNQGGEGSRLNAITAVSSTDVWAVGQTQELNGAILTLTQRFDGTRWTTVPSPNPGQVGRLVINSLTSIASAGDGGVVTTGSREIEGQCCLRTLAMITRNG